MRFQQTLTLLPFLVAPLVRADCQLGNVITDDEKTVESEGALCKPQGEGYYTFAMQNSLVGVPTFDGDNAFAGVTGSSAFIIYDNACNRVGVYGPSNEDNDCGIPYVIMENWLPYVLTVTQVNFAVGGGDFTFSYANGEYMIGENQATCEDISEGLRGVEACKTAFPLNGEPE
ncbi:hypothetical protein ASPCAL04711 [Aspergillus calidoustus]|uniref:Uncharacterized protein n=1 Tax=Aspergillus calidoustus TaxID=454130 RepID=A0A0U4Z1T8_ASPCI|nr:hypothetical protein ASPCAL04711 [Aspergillus calidoustus]